MKTLEIVIMVIQILLGALVASNIFWVKKWMKQREDKEEALDKKWNERESIWTEQGGVVTRDLYFGWCGDFRKNCPAVVVTEKLNQWRVDMLEKGGFMTQLGHMEFCERVVAKIQEGICNEFEHHREIMKKELTIISTTLDNRLLTALSKMQDGVDSKIVNAISEVQKLIENKERL